MVEADVETLTGQRDRHRIERVVSNLLSNAIKYSAGGAMTVTIEAHGQSPAHKAMLTVTGRGVGIPAIDLPFVFKRFHRDSNVRSSTLGSGIRLAGSRQIVEQHRGRIEVSSFEGDDSSFRLTLPIEPIPAGTTPAYSSPLQRKAGGL